VSGDLWPCDRLLGVQAVPTIAVPARTARRRPKRLRVYQSTPGRSLSEGLHSPFAPAQYFKARRHCATPTPEKAIERFVGIVDVEVGLCMAEILDRQLQRVTSLQVFCFGVADGLPRFAGGPGAAFEARVGAGEPNCHVDIGQFRLLQVVSSGRSARCPPLQLFGRRQHPGANSEKSCE
jgi:hypothetical protein